ncbi:MAG: hypothetical protein RBR93_12680 [Aliarcobacter butzleri]|nr:hypothetical protein [Aliarcobacter butzleri]
MSEEEYKDIATKVFKENLMNDLDGVTIFIYVSNLEKENKELQDKLDKIKEYCDTTTPLYANIDITNGVATAKRDILQIIESSDEDEV